MMTKQPLHKYIAWLTCVVLLNSACTQPSDGSTTVLPSATPVQPSVVAVIETTAPIATLTPSAEPVATPTALADTTVDALASQTTEGYYQLGSPTAPITMVDYSDFF
jgi:hypothetical protein